MSSDDNKTIAFEKPKKPKNKKSIGWIIGVVVLILISITFILPTTFLAGNNDIVFGSIRGKDISYTDQYFQTQASFASAQYGSQANTLQGMYSIFNQAFLSTAATVALNDMASEAGIVATDNNVDRAIVNSGFYSNGDGVFDADLYNNATNYEKDMFRAFAEKSVPSDMVIRDIASVHAPDAEVSLVQDLNSQGRTFDYVVVDSSLYPREDAINYALSNPEPFRQVSLNSVTYATEDEANTALANINSGSTTVLDEAAASSSTADGERGNVAYYALGNELVTAADADTVFNGAEGDIVGPLQTYGGYTIYEILSAPFMTDAPTDEEIDQIRSYIAANETDMMNAFLDEKSAEFQARLDSGENFFDAADAMGLEVVTVASTTANPNSFPLFSTFQMTDPGQNLYSATYFNTNYMNSLYGGEEGDVLPAETLTNGSRLFTRIGSTETSASSSTYIETMYDYFRPQMATTDLQNAIFMDPTFEDNFASVFFSRVLANGSN